MTRPRKSFSAEPVRGGFELFGNLGDLLVAEGWNRFLSQEVTKSAEWTGRNSHTSVVFDNKMWVIGGFDGSSRRNDVWYSSDGASWTQATSSAGWAGRNIHTSVVFDNKMWVMGGNDGSNRFNDVWYSSNGASWTQATSSAGWTGREGPTSVVFDNKMWVMGGYDGSYRNDVWKMKLY